jgi:hypothetical protein
MLVLLHEWRFCHLATRTSEVAEVHWPSEWPSQELVHLGDSEWRPLCLLHIDVCRTPDGFLGHNVYRKPTHTSLYQNHGSRHHHSNKQVILATLSHRQDCKKVVTRNAFIMSWSPLRPHLGKTGTVSSRYHVPTTRQWEHPNPKRSQPLSLYCHLCGRHTAASRKCWTDTASRILAFR